MIGTFKKAGHGIVGISATANLTNVKVNDLVSVIGDATVGFSAGKKVIGEVVAVDPSLNALNCTVEIFGSKIVKGLAAGAITAGDYVKAGPTLKNSFAKVVVLETTFDDTEIFGVAFNTAVDGAEFIIIPR